MFLSSLKTTFLTDLNQLNQFNLHASLKRNISFFGYSFGKKKKSGQEALDESIELVEAKESIWDHLTGEEIEEIRNRSNLTKKEHDRLNGQLSKRINLTELYQYKIPYVRNLYAQFGKKSGLKPGVCWPRKEELAFKSKYDETFNPPLDQLLAELKDEREQKAKEIEDRENEIRKGLKKLDKYKKEFFEKYNTVRSEAKEKEDKEAKRIEEICDFLGYSISPTDPRFEAAAEKKTELERKEAAKKGVVKKTKQARLLEELQALIEKNQEENKKTEEVDNKESDKLDKKED